MFELPAAGIIAYFWLGQRLDIWQILGCVLVLIGIIILQYEKSEEIQPIERQILLIAIGYLVFPISNRPLETRGIAMLCLYRETLVLLRTAMQPDHLEVAEQAVQIVDKSQVVILI